MTTTFTQTFSDVALISPAIMVALAQAQVTSGVPMTVSSTSTTSVPAEDGSFTYEVTSIFVPA